MFPVESEKLREQIRQEVIAPTLADNASAYQMDANGTYTRKRPADGEARYAAQSEILSRITPNR
jgi:polyphosphate kinase